MESDIFVGGEKTAARLRERGAKSIEVLARKEVLGSEYEAKAVAQDKSLIPLLLPVLRSGGEDGDAVKRLKEAIRPKLKPKPPGLAVAWSKGSTRSLGDLSEASLFVRYRYAR